MVEAVKRNYPQREIADASFELQRAIEAGERVLVGVNAFTDDGGESDTDILRIDPTLEGKQHTRLQAVRAARDGAEVERTLGDLRSAAAREDANLMEPLLAAARVRASEGEIIEALQDVFGTYTEVPVY